jgi:predicted transcriptional regulator
MVPWERLVRVTPNSGVGNVLAMMENTNVRLVPVVLGNQVEGTLSREQILRHLRQHIHTQDA